MRQARGRGFRADATAFLLSTGDEASHGNWAISYGDMVTLLLTFFMMFFGVREHESKMRDFQKALAKKAAPVTPPPSAAPPAARSAPLDDAWQTLSKLASAHFIKDQQRMVVEFPSVSFFDFGETGVTKEGKDELSSFVSLYRPFQNSLKLIVIGYTDTVPVRHPQKRRYADNLELSALRGVSAVRALIDLGLSQERMRFGGEGEWKGYSSYDAAKQGDIADSGANARKVVLVVEAEDNKK